MKTHKYRFLREVIHSIINNEGLVNPKIFIEEDLGVDLRFKNMDLHPRYVCQYNMYF